ncbi:CRISPR-associated protein Cas4 [Halostella salina]|uniref:CRISPR-associated protein Cas4 n=1 Tax=Halostella salina TaxID=1547897 RepID=UPI000EF7E757|nr:CRISPR-associated protein Cas4 [Halostella salina]
MSSELINVSDLNQYAYCPRRYWYLHFYDTQGRNYERIEGKTTHENKSTRGDWVNELYLESEQLGLKGKIDVLDIDDAQPVPVERKRAESGEYYRSDELQLAGYCLLLEEHIDEPVREGAIYLYETDQRMHVPITEDHRETVRQQVNAIQAMSIDSIPSLTDNPKKCEACSTREYCMPEETVMLEPEQAEGTGFEEVISE